MRVAKTLCVFLLGAVAPGQFRTPDHNTGLLVPGDVDRDGRDDVLILPGSGSARLYFGSGRRPFLTRGPRVAGMPGGILPDLPVHVGGYLYIPRINTTLGTGHVDVFKVTTEGKAKLLTSHQLDHTPGPSVVNSVKIAPLDRDIDGDGGRDLFAAWGEQPTGRNAAHAAYVSPTRMTVQNPIRSLPRQPKLSYVADVHPAFNAFRKQSEFMVTMSGFSADVDAGLGMCWVTVDDKGTAPKQDGGLWYAGVPPLAYHGLITMRSPSSFGAFMSSPQLGTPVLKLAEGRSVLFGPWVTAPYVQRDRADFLSTTPGGYIVDGCTADYDGDGENEMLFCESHRTRALDFVVVANPSPRRAYIQTFDLSLLAGQRGIWAEHGACGDFDGDGRPDVLLTCAAPNVKGSTFVMLRNDPRPGPGKPSLYFVQ